MLCAYAWYGRRPWISAWLSIVSSSSSRATTTTLFQLPDRRSDRCTAELEDVEHGRIDLS
jgi:hypothetical protein